MPRLRDLERRVDELVGYAIAVAADEHRAGDANSADMAMRCATLYNGNAVALREYLARRQPPAAPRPRRTVLRRVADFWDYLLTGR